MKKSGSVSSSSAVGASPELNHAPHRNHRRRAACSEPPEPAAKPALRNIVIPLELPPAGHALLKTIAIQANCVSVEELIRSLIIDECQAFSEAMADKESSELHELFTTNPREATRL